MLAALLVAALAAPPPKLPQLTRLARPSDAELLVSDGWLQQRNHLRALMALRAQRASEAKAPAQIGKLGGDGPLYRAPAIGPIVPEDGDPATNGLLIGARPGGLAISPGAGRVAYAGHFRRYGQVLILDHGRGWTSVVTGLSSIDIPQGTALLGGDPIGHAGGKVRLRLLHHGRAVDPAAILARIG